MANLNHLADFNDSRNSWKLAPLTSKLESPLAHLEDRIRNLCRHRKLDDKEILCFWHLTFKLEFKMQPKIFQ